LKLERTIPYLRRIAQVGADKGTFSQIAQRAVARQALELLGESLEEKS
jgi:hypothetical protein